jgi:hypothetical protein
MDNEPHSLPLIIPFRTMPTHDRIAHGPDTE